MSLTDRPDEIPEAAYAVYRYLFATLRARHPRFVARPHDAEDVVQEVLLRAVRHFKEIPHSMSPGERQWLRLALTHAIIDAARRQYAATKLLLMASELPVKDSNIAHELVLEAEEHQQLEYAVLRQNDMDQILIKAMLCGVRIPVVAKELGITTAATRKRIIRLIHRIRTELAGK